MVLCDVVCTEPEPLTVHQIERRMNLAPRQIREILDELCGIRLLRRLNTIIESYTGPALPFS